MLKQLNQIPPRMLLLLLSAVVGLTLAVSYLYVLKAPLTEYRRYRQTRALLEAEVANGAQHSVELAKLENEVEALESRLLSGSQRVSVHQMVAHIIDQLDRIAGHHDVQLVGVKPGSINQVFMFEEVPFDVEITGGYFSLYDWLKEVERELGPMVVKKYDITPVGKANRTRMKLTMVSYRSVDRKI
jgi:type IV pilus assembly protein PilO